MNIPSSSTETTGSDKESLKRESLYTLQILDEVATGRPLTQRDLSKKLGIALGMTNNYLKRLAREGYIQSTQAERKRLHYLLTPKGIAEKSALTYQYIKRSYHFFTEARAKIGQSLSRLERDGVKSVVLYKATVLTEIAVLVLLDTNLKLVAIVDDEMAGNQFLGQKIEPMKSLSALKFDCIVNTTEEPVETVAEHLAPYGVKKDRLFSLQ